MPLPVDQAERVLATDVTRSVIVQAPAGSGKTTLLVERYLKLLGVVGRPEEILAITFTRKAASEMQTRVLETLWRVVDEHEGSSVPDEKSEPDDAGAAAYKAAARALDRSRELGWRLLEQPGRLRIQTIDSFAMSLTSGLPVASGYDPGFALTENATELYQLAANRLLMRTYESDSVGAAVADFLEQCGNDGARAERLLVNMLSRRDQWLEVIASVVAGAQDDPDRVAAILEAGVRQLNETVIGGFEQAVGATVRHELDQLVEHAAVELDIDIQSSTDKYHLIAEFLTTAKGEFRRQVTRRQGFTPEYPELKQRVMNLIDELQQRGLTQQVASLRYLPEPAFDPDAVARLVNVCVNLALANADLDAVFAEARTSDFTTLILSARAALGSTLAPSELALALDYRIQHVLVDEFQDTSVSQFQLFESLLSGWLPGDGNSFFAVGDPMQSIYRFRDADVGLFYQAQHQGIADVPLDSVVLRSNFRAGPALVAWTNRVFRSVMGEEQDPVLGRIGYQSAEAGRSGAGDGSPVRLTLAEDAPAQVEAVVDRVEELLESDDRTVGLLVRSRTHLRNLIPELRSRGVQWHANDIDPLLNKPAVQDLLSLIRTLVDEQDRLAWFSLLRSPVVGLTLTDLQVLADLPRFPPELDRLQELPLSEDGSVRLANLLEISKRLAPRMHEQPMRNLVEAFWVQIGGPGAYPEPDALAHATRLLELVDGFGSRSLTAEALTQAASDLFATDLTDSRLEILTVHKAKGLEFDHVLVPFLERTTQSDEAELMLWRALPHGLLMGIRDDEGPFSWLARENRLRERHERQRLLYVACTRARSTLDLFALDLERPSESSMLAMLSPFCVPDALPQLMEIDSRTATIEEESEHLTPAQEDLFAPASVEVACPPPGLTRLRTGYHWQAPERPGVAVVPAPRPRRQEDPIDARLEVVRGIIVHAALERLARGQLPEDLPGYVNGEQVRWEAMARSHDLPEDDVAAVVADSGSQLSRVLGDPEGRWLLGARAGGRAELPLTAWLDGELQNLIIDRTFEEDGRRWVVDYKTAVPPEVTSDDELALKAFLDRELGRYRPQLTLYAEVVGAYYEQPVTAAIYFTALPRLVRIDLQAS